MPARNALVNFPVLETAVAGASTLTITGWARPGSTIELFLTDADPTGFGEGQAYATTVVEGSGADLDARPRRYAAPVNGLDPGHRQHESLPLHRARCRRA